MKRILVISCLLLVGSVTMASNSTNNGEIINITIDSDITGSWKTTMATPQGDIEMTFILKVEGETLTGSSNGPFGSFPISNGKVNGDEFSFDVAFQEMTIVHHCTIDGDTVTMKVTGVPGGDGNDIILTREK